jgi:hypothetical protein
MSASPLGQACFGPIFAKIVAIWCHHRIEIAPGGRQARRKTLQTPKNRK